MLERRPIHAARAILSIATAALIAVAAAVACSSSSEEEGDEGGEDSVAEAGNVDTGGGDLCAQPDAGVGRTCAKPEDCLCNLTCAAFRCVPRAKCDEALLAWEAPTTNTDGTCVDLAGFTIRWGREAGGPHPNAYDAGFPCASDGTKVACGDGGSVPRRLCRHLLGPLEGGVWYFAVHAYSEAGVESAPSGEASKAIMCP